MGQFWGVSFGAFGEGGIVLLMVQKSGDHQLRLVVDPIIYQVLYIPGGAGLLPSTVVIRMLCRI